MIKFVTVHGGLVPGQLTVVRFDNGNEAVAYLADSSASEAIARLGLGAGGQVRSVLLACGGAGDLAGVQLAKTSEVLGPAIATAVKVTGSVVVDGGTASGVMQITGRARAQYRDAIPLLVGVAPVGAITYPGGPDSPGLASLQKDHSHFILADATEWGGETTLMMTAAESLAGPAPVVMILAGGGEIARNEVLQAARRGWPVFVLAGTGGAADSLARLWRAHRTQRRRHAAILLPRRFRYKRVSPPAGIGDPALREIITIADLRLVTDTDSSRLARRLAWELQGEPVLKQGWQKVATYDRLAGRLRKTFAWTQGTVLTLGVAATLLALIHGETRGIALHWAVVVIPILASIVIAVAGRNAVGQRWVVLRAAAEAMKAEIYRYRTDKSSYAGTGHENHEVTEQERLAARLGAIDAKLMQTQASSGPLTPYSGELPPPMYGAAGGDDGLSALDAEQYLRVRVSDQLAYYHGKIRSLSRGRHIFQVLAIGSGGAGAVIAAAGLDVWVGLTSGIAAAALAYLGYLQVDSTIVIYNQAASNLDNLQAAWSARSPAARTSRAFKELVSRCESVLTAELGGWVQQMNDALRELANRQPHTVEGDGRSESAAVAGRDAVS
jgi:SLOG in TRPM, prokaryote/SMODS and SLOG-associating 2TM effector domain 1/Protein of unknown function (DUF4231)